MINLRNHPLTDAQASHPQSRSLSETLRWERFRDIRDNGRESPLFWHTSLGDTARVDTHQPYFTEFMLQLARQQNFDTESLNTLTLAGLVHDTGESKWVDDGKKLGIGDLAADSKTAITDKIENDIALRVIQTLNIPDQLKADTLTAYLAVVKGDNPELNQFFKAAERLEYLNTAMLVYFQMQKEDEGSSQLAIRNDYWLIAGVLTHDLPKIMERYLPKYDLSVGAYLRQNAKWIDGMFRFAETGINLGIVTKDKVTPFPEAKEKWESWRTAQIGTPQINFRHIRGNIYAIDTIYTTND